MPLPLTTTNIILAFREFLIAWINQIIYYNAIYPPTVFELKRCFDILIYTSRNPSLTLYISQVTSNCLVQFGLATDDSPENNPFVEQSRGAGATVFLILIFSLKSRELKRKYSLRISDLVADIARSIDTERVREPTSEFEVEVNEHSSKSSIVSIPGLNWTELHAQFKSLLYQHTTELKKFQQLSREKFGVDYDDATNNLFFKACMESPIPKGKNKDDWVRDARLNSSDPELESEMGTTATEPKEFIAIAEIDAIVFSVSSFNEYIK